MSTPALASIEALGSRNLEIQNALLSHQLLSAFIGNVEYMQNQLLLKMDVDRQRTDRLKERLTLQQDLWRSVQNDAQSDDKKFTYFISFDESTMPPFENWIYAPTSANVPASLNVNFNGMSVTDIMLKGGRIWYSAGGDKLSGKQLAAYYDQQAEATKSAMSALNAVTSQDNLTLQSLRSKVDSNTQLLSTIIKNEKDRKEGVMRNM